MLYIIIERSIKGVEINFICKSSLSLRDEDSETKCLSHPPFGEFSIMGNMHLRHYMMSVIADLVYSNIAVTLIEQSHII